MPKIKPSGRPTPSRRLVDGTRQAYDLLEKGKAAEAVKILVELDHAYPNTPEVLGGLVNSYYDLNDFVHYEHAIRRLIRIDSKDPDISYALAGAYLVNGRPALAIRAFQDAVRRWPKHPQAGYALQEIQRLIKTLREQTGHLDWSEERLLDLYAQHDDLRYCMSHGDYRRGRQIADKLLQKFPDFVPVINNLVQLLSLEGQFDQAIQYSLHVLEIEPDNIHALSNLARLHFLGGRPDEATQYAQRLKLSQANAVDRWIKIAEALTFLEDDEGVLALDKLAKDDGELKSPGTGDLFYHLLAAAAYFQGKKKDAQKYWQKSLAINPRFDWALENVTDLKKPAEEQSGIWAFPFESWLLASAVRNLSSLIEKKARTDKEASIQQTLSHFFEAEHPEVLFLASHLVARSDAAARNFVVRMAAFSNHPALVSAARDYVFGRRGSFQERFQAAQTLADAGLLPSGPIQLGYGREKRDAVLFDIEITDETVESNLPPQALALATQAWKALRAQDGVRAQGLLEQALALAPDDPSLLNNLVKAYEMQGQVERARQMMRDLHVRFPDYFFGVISAASQAVIEGDLDWAHQLLNGLMQRKKMHISELIAFCQVQIQVSLAEGNREVAHSWIETWEKVDPDDPALNIFRRRVNRPEKE